MTQGERVKAVRKALKLNGTDFGAKLGVGNTAISKIEKGVVSLTDSMEKLICREFKVCADWLRSGEGEMFVTLSQAEKLAEWAGETLGLPLDHPRVRAWCMLAEMPDETLAVVMAAIDRCHAAEKSEAEGTQSESK